MRLIIVVATIIATIACGSDSPTTPTPTVPILTGQWGGTYTVTSCQEFNAAVGTFCGAPMGGLTFTPQQSGTALSGTLSIGGFSPIPVTGTIGADARVALQGSGPIQFTATLALNAFQGVVSGNTMTGTLGFTVSTPVPVGAATITGTYTITR